MFNPLMGISRADARLQLPLFRNFNFKLEWEHEGERTQLCLRSLDPLAGAVEKKLRPHLGGPWRKMAIAKIPLTLRVQVDQDYLESLSLKDEDAVMGRLVDMLSTWYSDKRQRRGHRYKATRAPRYRRGLTLLIDLWTWPIGTRHSIRMMLSSHSQLAIAVCRHKTGTEMTREEAFP